ncbi:MAG: GNAT family N-acetyltransferase [Kibdelosporangium sp.]
MTDETAVPRVVHNEAEHRYEVFHEDELAGFTRYRLTGDQVVFTHTQIDDKFGGKGLGKVLAAGALDDVVQRGKVIVPVCPFIAGFVKKNSLYGPHVKWPDEQS